LLIGGSYLPAERKVAVVEVDGCLAGRRLRCERQDGRQQDVFDHREHRGRYRLDNLIARHSVDAGERAIVPELTADCLHRDSAALMERCDILLPELRELLRAG